MVLLFCYGYIIGSYRIFMILIYPMHISLNNPVSHCSDWGCRVFRDQWFIGCFIDFVSLWNSCCKKNQYIILWCNMQHIFSGLELMHMIMAYVGNPFCITGPSCGESTSHPIHKGPVMQRFNVFFVGSLNILCNTVQLLAIWDAMTLMWYHCTFFITAMYFVGQVVCDMIHAIRQNCFIMPRNHLFDFCLIFCC